MRNEILLLWTHTDLDNCCYNLLLLWTHTDLDKKWGLSSSHAQDAPQTRTTMATLLS